MTLNGHFTLNFHYYKQCFQKLFYTLTTEPIYRIFFVVQRDQQRCVEADYDLQNIWDPWKDRGSFVAKSWRSYIFGTLTNKANITIEYYLVQSIT